MSKLAERLLWNPFAWLVVTLISRPVEWVYHRQQRKAAR